MTSLKSVIKEMGVKPKKGDFLRFVILSKELKDVLPQLKESITPRKNIDYFDGSSGKDGRDGRDGKDGKDGRNGKDGWNGRDGKDANINMKEIIKTIMEKIAQELDKRLGELDFSKYLKLPPGANKEAVAKYGVSRLRHGGGDIVQYYDLSSYLNGSTKVFTIPVNRKIIQITSSSEPFVFRPVTDFTGAGTRTLTFTANVTAATMLASGQSIIVLYVQ